MSLNKKVLYDLVERQTLRGTRSAASPSPCVPGPATRPGPSRPKAPPVEQTRNSHTGHAKFSANEAQKKGTRSRQERAEPSEERTSEIVNRRRQNEPRTNEALNA